MDALGCAAGRGSDLHGAIQAALLFNSWGGGGFESIEYSVCGNRYVVLFYDLVIEEENPEKLQERE